MDEGFWGSAERREHEAEAAAREAIPEAVGHNNNNNYRNNFEYAISEEERNFKQDKSKLVTRNATYMQPLS